MRDPYEVLGVDRKASEADIKSAFRRMAKKLHPDANKTDPKAASRFAELNAAYEILGEEDKRKAFDRGEIDAEGKPRFQGFEGFGAGAGRGQGGFAPESEFETFSFGPEGFTRSNRRDRGAGYVRAPVSGSVSFAGAGKLTVLASGSREDVERCRPYFEHLARKIFYVGEQEAARTLKLVLNMMVGTTAAMLGEALALGKQAGLDWSSMLEVVGESVVASPLVSYKLPSLAERDFTAAFEARLMAKDFDLLMDVADRHGVAMPIAEDVRNYWRTMIELGMGDLDFSACVVVAERSVKDRAKSLR